jgi:hypothetical protein
MMWNGVMLQDEAEGREKGTRGVSQRLPYGWQASAAVRTQRHQEARLNRGAAAKTP